mmetsp:Transcript_15404/g.37858  ORF Transcript_15404/g.37858 Transcript_15404/m.37858 type:complete len:240 (+) Transcript_15404:1526-2245(+)
MTAGTRRVSTPAGSHRRAESRQPSLVSKNTSSTRVTGPCGSEAGSTTVSVGAGEGDSDGPDSSRIDLGEFLPLGVSSLLACWAFCISVTTSARSRGVGAAARWRICTRTPDDTSSCPMNCMASSECPPSSKKSSSAPTCNSPSGLSTSSKRTATASSASPSGETYVGVRSAMTSLRLRSASDPGADRPRVALDPIPETALPRRRSEAGAGSAARSTFPLAVIGILPTPGTAHTMAAGIM